MKKLLMYLFMGVGLLYTRALARLWSKTDARVPEESHNHWDEDWNIR